MDSSTGQAMVTETSTETFTETATASASSMEEARAEDAAENPAEVNVHEHSGRGNGTVLPERYDDRFPRAQEAPADQPPAPEAPGANPEMNEHPVAPAQVEAPAPAAPPAAPSGETYFQNCAAARAAGAAPLHAGEPGYRSQLDRDKDGVACE
ncbi:excalibur calcium-binding domain-containing protein [Corynebacterium propinquum]